MTDEDACTIDFCEELKTLTDVHEVRGCPHDKIAQSMIYAGLCSLQAYGFERDEAAKATIKIIESWRRRPDEG